MIISERDHFTQVNAYVVNCIIYCQTTDNIHDMYNIYWLRTKPGLQNAIKSTADAQAFEYCLFPHGLIITILPKSWKETLFGEPVMATTYAKPLTSQTSDTR